MAVEGDAAAFDCVLAPCFTNWSCCCCRRRCIWLQCRCCLSCCCCRQLAHAAALLTTGAASLLPQNRMNKLESLRLEVDSRRRTVGKLGKKVGCSCCCACR